MRGGEWEEDGEDSDKEEILSAFPDRELHMVSQL